MSSNQRLISRLRTRFAGEQLVAERVPADSLLDIKTSSMTMHIRTFAFQRPKGIARESQPHPIRELHISAILTSLLPQLSRFFPKPHPWLVMHEPLQPKTPSARSLRSELLLLFECGAQSRRFCPCRTISGFRQLSTTHIPLPSVPLSQCWFERQGCSDSFEKTRSGRSDPYRHHGGWPERNHNESIRRNSRSGSPTPPD